MEAALAQSADRDGHVPLHGHQGVHAAPQTTWVIATPPNNLPIQLTSFIGRAREKAEVKRLLATTRLLTLTGPGGSGKTRLALEVATEVLQDFPDGTWVVELAPLAVPPLVVSAVATGVCLRDESGRPLLSALEDYLRRKHVLLVLDNCEHLIDACAQLAEALLRSCPHVRILATSRETLDIPGGVAWSIPPLSLPDPAHVPPIDRLAEYEAVRLFVERAAAVVPAFTLTDSNAPAVVQLTRRLDGLPLAIELAAARVKVLTPAQIAARLDDRFHLLTSGGRTTLPRHQTLQAVMDWSYGLLTDRARILLRRLSVFVGGWTLEAAEAVCAGGGVALAEVLDLLMQLSDKSLVVVETRGSEARYRLLETVRQYGRARLTEAGEAEAMARRHRDWALALAEQAEPELRRAEQGVWLDRLEIEHDNLRAALEWSKTEKDGAEVEAHLAGVLWWFWFLHGHWNEGRRWLEGVMTRSAASPAALTKPLEGAAFFAWRQNDFPQATALSEQGVTLCRQLGDREGLTWFHHHLGVIALRQGDYQEAEMLFDHGLALARELGDPWLIGLLLVHMAIPRASQEDYESAAGLFTESLTIARKIGDRFLTAFVLYNQGYLFLSQRDEERAADFFRESLTLSRELQDRFVSHESLEGLAGVACAQNRYYQAALLLGATDVLRTTMGHRFSAHRERGHDHYAATARAALGDAAFATAWAQGQAMTLEHAIERALGCTSPTESRAAGNETLGKEAADRLTAREREVAALVAHGLTNRQIAANLVVTERTAETHVHNILNKLGFTTRAQIAAWAVEQRLRLPADQ